MLKTKIYKIDFIRNPTGTVIVGGETGSPVPTIAKFVPEAYMYEVIMDFLSEALAKEILLDSPKAVQLAIASAMDVEDEPEPQIANAPTGYL